MNCPRVWAEVDISAIGHNVRELKRITQPQAKLMAVVKANAYGHGLVEVAEEALKNGAQALGIAEVSEGIALRKAGIAVPILILGYTPPDFVRELIQYDLIQTVYSFEIALSLSDAALLHGKKLKIHIKVDTGMGRLGILIDPLRPFPQITNALKEIESIAKLKGVSIEGIFTHFALS
ncbi:MAG: alanine racemase, partial [Desulfobacterales bacterium]|nr:alanine racemase [Desulfobacterales bacterium]